MVIIPPFIGKSLQWSDMILLCSNCFIRSLNSIYFGIFIKLYFSPPRRDHVIYNMTHYKTSGSNDRSYRDDANDAFPSPKKQKNSWLLRPPLSNLFVFKFVHLRLMTGEALQWDRLRPGPGDLCCVYLSWFWSVLSLSWDVMKNVMKINLLTPLAPLL